MKIVRNLPGQLILAHAPWLAGGALIVCILALCGAGIALLFNGEPSGLTALAAAALVPGLIFALFIVRDQVIFDAQAGTVTLQRQTLFRYSSFVRPLSAIERAELDELSDTARPVLVFGDGPCPLVEAFISGNGPRQAVSAINDWHRNWRRGRAHA